MTTTASSVPKVPPSESPRGRLYWEIADALTLTKRNLIGYTRVPEAVFFSSVQPIMFVLLFRYVFGGAIPTPGYTYVQFLMPGIFVQTVVFGSIGTAIGLAEDLQKGLIERFRALPMSRSAVLAGRTTADLCRNVFVIVLMTAVGYAVGYRIGTNFGEYLLGALLILLFAYAVELGPRLHRTFRCEQRDGTADVLPNTFSADLRVFGVRPNRNNARLATSLRPLPAGERRGERRPLSDVRAAQSGPCLSAVHPCSQHRRPDQRFGVLGRGLVRGDLRRSGAHLRPALSPQNAVVSGARGRGT